MVKHKRGEIWRSRLQLNGRPSACC
jgi:hypothetical protein